MMSAGIDPRGKKKIEIPLESHCTDSNRISYDPALHRSGKLTGINTSTNAVEARPESRIGVGSDATALVRSGADGAVHPTNDSPADGQGLGICTGKAATGVGVERRLIVRVVVHSLDYINFASSRPVRSCGSKYQHRKKRMTRISSTYRCSKRLAMCHTQSACGRSLR